MLSLFALGSVLGPLLSLVAGTSIVVAGRPVEVGRPVVLWNEPEGFDGYAEMCVESSYAAKSKCCRAPFKRYSQRKGMKDRSLEGLKKQVFQLVLHLDGCVNSRSCFYSMHDTPRPDGGCGLSAHFMVDADGTIYQTLDLLESAWHAEQSNSFAVGVEICNRGDASRNELDRLPADYRTRPVKDVVINGHTFHAFDFRPEQYLSVIALARALVRVFPEMKPVIPERNGRPLLETLPDPLAFHGIVGHLHVDKQMNKWDPGAFDWDRLMRALHGLQLPLPARNIAELPTERDELQRAVRNVFRAAEERTTGFYPMASGRLWHSGVHLRGMRGQQVQSPARGRLMAVRLGREVGRGNERDTSSRPSATGFAVIRHDLETPDGLLTFFSLLAHLGPADVSAASPVGWIRELVASGNQAVLSGLRSGRTLLLDTPVEAGDVIGLLGEEARGPEVGPELHFEILTTTRLPAELGKPFRYVEAASDGPFVSEAGVALAADANDDQQITAEELRSFFSNPEDPTRREALRRVAVRHPHEWGDRMTEQAFINARELKGLPEDERRRFYGIAIAPYLFWTNAVADHVGLPRNQTAYVFNPLTFLAALAARRQGFELHWPSRSSPSDRDLEAARLTPETLADWWPQPGRGVTTLIFGAAADTKVAARKRQDIPLIVLPPSE
jgi:N-acetyl-anhydromuramyl-L-alanine amidase AmpD